MCGFFKQKRKTLDKELESDIKNNFIFFHREQSKKDVVHVSYAIIGAHPFATIDTNLKIAFYKGDYFSFDLGAIEPNVKKDINEWCNGPEHMKKIPANPEGKSYAPPPLVY